MKRYPVYKESSIPFVDEIPDTWKEIRIKNAFSTVSDKNHVNEQMLSVFLNQGVILYRRQ